MASMDAALRPSVARAASAAGSKVTALEKLLARSNASLAPLFGESAVRLRAMSAESTPESGTAVPDSSAFYSVTAPEDRLDELSEQLVEQEGIEAAYVKPAAEMPVADEVNDMVPLIEAPRRHHLTLPRGRSISTPHLPGSTPTSRGPKVAEEVLESASSTSKAHGGLPMKTYCRIKVV